MKFLPSRTYRLGPVTVSLSRSEIVFILKKKNDVLVKTFRRSNGTSKKHLVSAAALIIVSVGLFSFFNSSSTPDPIDTDEKEKNRLLFSDKTDYTTPVENKKLVIRRHKVKRGETLSHIAQKYGVSIDTICGSSNLRSYHLIREGQILSVPNREGILYTMKKGNSLTGIARKYRVSLKKIVSQNDLVNPDFVSPGKLLFIPDAKPQNIIRGWMWPTRTRRITCGYGWRRNPFNRHRREFHAGMDIGARYEWIRSSRYGKVAYTGWLGGYGKTVIVAHPGGWKTLYAHLSRIIVRRGQYVKQGQSIARSGNTGRSTGPHLHFEIIKRGRHKNPYVYLRRSR